MMIRYKGVDLSHWNAVKDWNLLSDSVDFIMLKLGGSDSTDFFYIDREFEARYLKCKELNIPIGCYWFCGQNSFGSAAAEREARYIAAALENKKIEYPIAIDFETRTRGNRQSNTIFVRHLAELLEEKEYYVSIYGSDISTFQTLLDKSQLTDIDKWVARYGKEPTYIKNYGMWQNTNTGIVRGITRAVDIDYAYKNYPKIMKNKHLNGY